VSSLPTDITKYYFDNFDKLPEDKKFHFISRLGSWNKNEQAINLLSEYRHKMLPDNPKVFLQDLISHPPNAKINARERREPYFAKYPDLRGLMMALFRVRHLLFIYDIDLCDDLLEVVSKKDLYDLSDKLRSDLDAVSVLSTYAINYIYLVEVILFPRNEDVMTDFLNNVLDMGNSYSMSAEDSLLLIYLYTHCIIGASNFYQATVKEKIYDDMLTRIEERIDKNFHIINLDNKFEFLVCCEITGYKTHLRSMIQDEANNSVSCDGIFLIDTINSAAQGNKTSFSDSEHRNVLYIMSQSSFSGHNKLSR
jgi:hypothetical protein